MSVLTVGLEKIEFSDLAPNGGLGTSFAAVGKTLRDSLTLTTDDPEIIEFFSEEDDEAVETSETPGSTSIALKIMDPDASTYEEFFGGTVNGDDWAAPTQAVKVEKSIKITPKKGFIHIFPRCSVVAKFDASFGRNEPSGILITATRLTPTLAGESHTYLEKKV